MSGVMLLLIVGAVLAFGPLLLVWSLNALFALAIPYTLKTWFAALVLGMLVSGSGKST